MFKSGRWRSEKNKIKAVFRLQFHATEVLLSGGDSLMISVIPDDVGKPTAKLEKVKVNNGGCYWEKPVYETVKFTQDPKTGKINERSYHFIIATGSSKFGILGEVSFDFANYALATKLSTVSLPLKTAKFEAVLHVSIERIQDSVDQREVNEVETLKHGSEDHSLRIQLSNSDMDQEIKKEMDQEIKANSAEEGSSDKIISHVAELKENRGASIGSGVTISSSDSISGLDTSQEFGIKNNSLNEDRTNFVSALGHASVRQKPVHDASRAVYEEQQRAQSEYSGGSAPDASTDESVNSPQETLTRERSQDNTDILIEKLKTEIAVLARQSEVSELELQTLRKNIVKESKRGQDLSKELISVKEERDAFREECERLKDLQKRADAAKVKNKLQVDGGDPRTLLEELRQELNHEKDLNANLRLQLQKTQESNSELIFAVRDLDELLEEKNREIMDVSNKSSKSENTNNLHICDADVDEDQKALEELVKEHSDEKDAYLLEQKVMDLCSEIELCRRDRDDLEMQMEQLSLDYEILKQENHDISYKLEQSQLQEQLKMQYECSTSYATLSDLESQVESLEIELKKQSKEFSDSLITITELENQVISLEEELEKQAQGFESDLEELINAKVEQEKRAIRAEETLRKAQRENVNTAERLQKEFRGLYTQMSSTFDVNDKLATKALAEANELRLEKKYLEEMLQQAKSDVKAVTDLYEAKLLEFSSEIVSKTKQIEQMQSETEYKSTEIENHRKHADETHRLLSEEILVLQSEIARLAQENNVFSEQEKHNELLKAELEQMKACMKENEILVLRGITENDELEFMSRLLKTEVEKLQKELQIILSAKDEAEMAAENLQSEVETLRTKYDELEHSVLENDLEKEDLRNQVIQLKDDLKTRQDMLSIVEKKVQDTFSQVVLEVAEARHDESVAAFDSTEDVTLVEKMRLLKGQLKLKEVALETSSTTFLKKDNDLQVAGDTEDPILDNEITEAAIAMGEDLSVTESTSGADGCPMTFKESSNETRDNELRDPATYSRDEGKSGKLSNEMELLKERNQSMEGELKDMQDRYSEISLKFAEVEGERQKLEMKLRSIKNSKKSLS